MSENTPQDPETVAEEQGSQPEGTPEEPTAGQVSVADKREWLKANGYEVGARGKLSAAHEQAYNTGTPAEAQVPTAL